MHYIIWLLIAGLGITGALEERRKKESQKEGDVKSENKVGTIIDTGKNHATISDKPAEPVTVTDEGETELNQELEPCPESKPSSPPPQSS